MNDPYEFWNPEEATPKSDGKPDEAIVPYVESLRKRGIVTYSSCSGHEEEDKWAHIQLADMELDLGHIDKNSRGFSHVKRLYPGQVWDIRFRGLNHSEEELEKNMRVVFEAIGAEFPSQNFSIG